MKKRILSFVLVAVMLFALMPLSALAADVVDYDKVDYSTQLNLGENITYSASESDSYIDTPSWSGYAKGYTVELEADKEYTFVLIGENFCGDYYLDRAFALMPETLTGNFSDDALVYETEYNDFGRMAFKTSFTVATSGKYKVLIWGYVDDETGADVFGEDTHSFSVVMGETSKVSRGDLVVDIYTADDLTALNDVHFILYDAVELNFCADIDMSDVILLNLNIENDLVVNGNNRYIKGLKMPLFSALGYVEMYDLGIECDLDFADSESDYVFQAPIFKFADAVKMYNCHTKGTIDVEAKYIESVSGFVGDIGYGEFENCSADVDINIESVDETCYVGGFITYIGNEATFKNCHYNGDISIKAENSNAYNIGGFVGNAYYCRYENCSATGTVSVDAPDTATSSDIGGFAGDSLYGCEFINCVSDVDVSAKGMTKNVGGFAGHGSNSTFKNCYSLGSVDGGYTVGSFIGDDADSIFVNAYATGDVKGYEYVGGFAGYGDGSTFQNCYTSGSVSTDNESAANVASFVAYVASNGIELENCYAAESDLLLVLDKNGAEWPTAGVYELDFANETDVSATVDTFNKFVEEAVDPELLEWITVPDSTPTFGLPEIEAPKKPCYHTYDGVFDDWNDDEHWEYCENPDCTYPDEPYNSANHVLEKVSDTATCDEDGILIEECKHCGYVAESDSYAKGHKDEDGDSVCDICGHVDYILGDVDNDGDVDADDYILLKRVYFGSAKLENLSNPETAFVRSDVNKDGDITGDDYIILKRVYFGMAKLG